MSFEFDDNGGIVDKAAQDFAKRKQDLAVQPANAINEDAPVVQVFDEVAPSQPHDAEPAVAPSDFAAAQSPEDNLPVGDPIEQPQTPAEEQSAPQPAE